MKISELKNYIDFYGPTGVSYDATGEVATYVLLCSVWAKVTHINSARAMQYGILDGAEAYEIFIRTPIGAALDKDCYIQFGAKQLTIQSIIDIEDKHRWYQIIAHEK